MAFIDNNSNAADAVRTQSSMIQVGSKDLLVLLCGLPGPLEGPKNLYSVAWNFQDPSEESRVLEGPKAIRNMYTVILFYSGDNLNRDFREMEGY